MFEKVELDEGRIVLWRGDAREVLPSISDESIECAITDPPYGHNNNNGDLIHRREAALGRGEHGEARAIDNDGVEANDLFREVLPEIFRILRPGCCYCCGGGGPDPQFGRWSLWMDEVFKFKQMVVWDKGPMGMGWHYRRSYETVLVGEKPGAACRWFGGRDTENIIRPGAHGIRKIIPQADAHPCAKPVELYAHFMRLHTVPDDWIVDPFMGHGPCGVAAVRLSRRFIGIESSEQWFGKARKRIQTELDLRNGDGPLMRAANATLYDDKEGRNEGKDGKE